MTTTLEQHTGTDPSPLLAAKLRDLGGQVTEVSDKSITLEFPTATNARLFREAAEAEGHTFN